MTYAVKVDNAGRIVLPSEVRRRLNLSAGTRIRLEVVAERIELTPESEPEPTLVRRGRRMVLPPTGSPLDAAAAVREEREAQSRLRRNR